MFESVYGGRHREVEPLTAGHDSVARKTVANPNLSPASREQYRQLAAILHNAQALSGVKAVMIASAVGGEGKTLTAANLALTFAESYQRRVLLVDADFRKPSLDRMFTGGAPYAPAEAATWTADGPVERAEVAARHADVRVVDVAVDDVADDPLGVLAGANGVGQPAEQVRGRAMIELERLGGVDPSALLHLLRDRLNPPV